MGRAAAQQVRLLRAPSELALNAARDHRIIDYPGLNRPTMGIAFPPPCYVQGRQPPDQAAQSHIQPGLECLSRDGASTTSLGNLFQCIVTTLYGKNFLLKTSS